MLVLGKIGQYSSIIGANIRQTLNHGFESFAAHTISSGRPPNYMGR